jgi:hypothetical protein
VDKLHPDKNDFWCHIPKLITDEQKDCWVSMHANQLPIMINNATNDHKLQVASVDNIFVHE